MKFTDSDFERFRKGGGQLLPFLRDIATDFCDELFQREAAELVAGHQDLRLPDGRRRLIMGGKYSRTVVSPVGSLALSVPRVRDRAEKGDEAIVYRPSMLPRFLRKLDAVEDAIPFLYLKGLSSGDLAGAFRELYGADVKGFSSGTIQSLTRVWTGEYQEWCRRDLSDGPEYPYVFGDAIFFPVRGEKDHQAVLALMGISSEGAKELLGVASGCSENTMRWKEMLLDLRDRGLKPPKLVIGDAGQGLWSGLAQVFPDCAAQTCWEHKARNVTSHLPKSLHRAARSDLKQVYMAPSLREAERQIDKFDQLYKAKYPKAAASVTKNKERLTTFYGFPAEHWVHLRTTNIIESVFSMVRNRTHKMRGISTIETMSTMVFKLVGLATSKFRRITAPELLKDVCAGKTFVDGKLVPKGK